MDVDEDAPDAGGVRCDMVLCVDSGPAHDLKWCPLPANDPATVCWMMTAQ